MAYLTLDEFRNLTPLPNDVVDLVEQVKPGFIELQLAAKSALMDGRLRKRYAAPFSEPYPVILQDWLCRLVSYEVDHARLPESEDVQSTRYEDAMQRALDEIKEAADAVGDAGGTPGTRGMFDLPLRSDTTTTGIAYGTPLSYSEQSPYVWQDVQYTTARDEDSAGTGSGDS